MSSDSTPQIHFKRIYYVVFGLVLFWIMLEMRLFIIQVNRHDFYVSHSQLQSAKKIVLAAKRGTIFDRAGEPLATNLIHYDIGIDLQRVENRQKIAQRFSAVFKRSIDYYLHKMKRKSDFVYLERKISEADMVKLQNLEDHGLVILKDFRRYYPYDSYASQLLGFTDTDDMGIAGLELQYEEELKGEDGWTFLLADALRRFGRDVDFPQILPIPGHDLILTIDKNIQTIVEDELELGVKANNADLGMAVLMDPQTGQVLAMATSPGYNLNNPEHSAISHRRNRVIADNFEPGSTFKIFPAAALLQENIKKEDDIVFCENGYYKFYNHVIHDSKKYGWLSFRKVIELSSNIGMLKLALEVPNNTFYKYLKNFGFDSETGINLISETTGMLPKPEQFSGLSKGVIAFGQEVGVTAIQLVSAFSAVVNGGELMRPYVLDKIVSNDGELILQNEPQVVRRVITPETAALLREFMLDAIRHGTGKKVDIKDILMGGKTGTAQKFDKNTKSYKRNAYLSSFIGFAPYESPRYVLGIFFDEPGPYYYGGDVAAPVFSRIMQRLLKLVPDPRPVKQPMLKIVDRNKNIPDLRGLHLAAAEEYCIINDLSYEIEGEGSHVIKQKTENGSIYLSLGEPAAVVTKVPDLRGKTLREALKLIDFSRFQVKISGTGRIRSQSPTAGSSHSNNQVLLLTCAD
jgi:cell division protein FtsI/penicillin-binding protein 2